MLVEGASKTDPTRRFGHSPHNRIVNFDGDAPVGALVMVQVKEASVGALYGQQGRLVSAANVVVPEAPVPLEAVVA